jgi:hypothetical protein
MKNQLEPKMDRLPSLESLEIELPKFTRQNERKGVESPQLFQAIFSGIPVKVSVESLGFFQETGLLSYAVVLIKVTTENTQSEKPVFARVEVSRNHQGNYESNVEVTNDNQALKKIGLGRALWKISVRLIQKFSDQLSSAVEDTVIKHPTLKLSSEKWDKLFHDLLVANQYIQKSSHSWKKIYKPSNPSS